MDPFPRPTLRLALSLAGLSGAGGVGGDVRAQIGFAASEGYRAVALNGAAPGVRARELGRSARRDLASIIRREGMACAGVDLWVPPARLLDPAHADPAAEALREGARLAADLAALTDGEPVLSTLLPDDPALAGAVEGLAEAAQACGCRVADHAWPPPERDARGPIGVGVDPAGIWLAEGSGADPAREVSRRGGAAACVRLSDADGSGRVAPGDGRLDALAYSVAVETSGYRGWVVVDTRGLDDPVGAAARALERFGGSGGVSFA